MFDVGRKLSVGDCALFQAGNAPPFIGILRNVIHDKDAKKFVVNWLYRPADVKLAKGGPLEAAPTEIFYSFHKDEISAASLLHPCKVAFLRKGIELPPGVSHFVCRRVYDTANRCLWWLTDRDYTDEHQDEVDLLLERTKLEMQATVQSEGPSPRALIGGPTSSQQLKAPGSEAVQNATYAAPSKSKKRDRTDQSLEPSKRERSVKAEDGELSPLKRDRSMKPEEIASITDKDGGLINAASAERLVQLMQQERNDGSRKPTDVASRRLLLAGVVAATEREDPLSLFVQLGGLPMLDDWLQEAHKGKGGGEGGSPKEGDKGVEELLLTLLKALDKLPVDLDALKTCCVGKSVNHLRSHRNLEIQKKARKLVDIWKKRVDAEMKLNGEAKPGSNQQIWNYKQQSTPEVLHSHVIKPGVPTEVAVKSSGAFAGSAKPMTNGTSSSEGIAKAASPSVGKISSILASASPSTMKREENDNNNSSSKVSSNTLSADVKEEKSGNSSLQPQQSNGQAWGNGSQVRGAAVGSSWKEEVKSATMGGTVSSKPSGSSTRHLGMSAKGLLGANLSASSKDLLGGKPLVWSRTAVTDKLPSPSPGPLDKGPTDAGHETSREHRLIVRIPNPGRSPARQSAFDHGTPGSRGLSPNMTGRSSSLTNLDASDVKGRVANGNLSAPSSDANGDAKSGALASRGGRPLPGEDERDKFGAQVHSDVTSEGEKRAGESTRAEPDRPAKEYMDQNGLVRGGTERNGVSEGATGAEEGKKAESAAGEPIAAAADGVPAEATSMEAAELGISLLASVAASEIRTGAGESVNSRGQQEDKNLDPSRPSRVSSEAAGPRSKDGSSAQPDGGEGGVVKEQNESRTPQEAVANVIKNGREEIVAEQGNDGNMGKLGGSGATEKLGQEPRLSPMRDCNAHDSPKHLAAPQDAAARLSETSNGSIAVKSSAERGGQDRHTEENGAEPMTLPTGSGVPFNKGMKNSGASSPIMGSEVGGLANKSAKKDTSDEKKGQVQGKAVEVPNGYTSNLGADLKALQPLASGDNSSVRLDRSNSAVNSAGIGEAESELLRSVRDAGERKGSPLSATEAVLDGAQELKRAMDRRTLGRVPSSQVMGLPGLTPSSIPAAVPSQQHGKPAAAAAPHTLPAGEPATPEQATETAGPSEGVVNGSDVSERPDFDLNEGFAVEESPQDESTTSPPVPPAPIPPMASAPALSAAVATPVAIVTATKGAFVLPASPMRTKSELGWKGSAATSAFRPAEPRRTPERTQSTTECPATAAPEIAIGCGPSAVKAVRPSLDLNIDLNVDDERNFEDGLGAPVATAPALPSIQGPGGFGGVVHTLVPVHSIPTPGPGKTTGEYASHGHLQRLPPLARNSPARPVLDLNLLDDGEESGTLSAADAGFLHPPTLIPSANVANSSSSSITRRPSVMHDFDLNDGPLGEEGLADDQPVLQPSISRNAVPPPPMMPTVPGLRRIPEAVNPSGFGPGISLKPAAMPDFSSTSRAESPYSVAAAAAAQSYLSAGAGAPQHFNPADLYRGNVAPPNMPPAPPYPAAAQVPYPYGGGFPGGSAVFPFTSGAGFNPNNVAPYIVSSAPVNFPITSAGAVAAQHFTRPPPPYLIGMPDVGVVADNANGGWSARPSLDLNAGPEPVDGDGAREDVMSAARSSSAMAGHTHFDQMRALRHVAGGGAVFGPVPPSKRKEPENGWDMSRNGGFKQQAWR